MPNAPNGQDRKLANAFVNASGGGCIGILRRAPTSEHAREKMEVGDMGPGVSWDRIVGVYGSGDTTRRSAASETRSEDMTEDRTKKTKRVGVMGRTQSACLINDWVRYQRGG